jgi:hypothetical protein
MIADHVAQHAAEPSGPSPSKPDATPEHTARALQLFADYGQTGGFEIDACVEAMYGDGRTLVSLTKEDVSLLPLKLKRLGAKSTAAADPAPEEESAQ